MFTLRYCDTVPLDLRKHAPTEFDWPTFADADRHREEQPAPDLLEVVPRGTGRATVSDVLDRYATPGVSS